MTNPSCEAHCSQPPVGMVVGKELGRYAVRLAGGVELTGQLASRLRKQLVYSTADPRSASRRVQQVAETEAVDPVAVGDQVEVQPDGHGSGLITAVRPRRNQLARRAAGAEPREQVIVANADLVLAVVAAREPALKWPLVDRYLADAEHAGIPAAVVVTKVDLRPPSELPEMLDLYRSLGYGAVATSSVTGDGLGSLRELIADGLVVMIGKSGVGKTSLLNALQPDLAARVSAVGERTGKGRHTTTSLALYDLVGGGQLVDTPGMREFGLWDVAVEAVAELFPEFRPHLGGCRFADCQHADEPGCALRQALADGLIHPRRWDGYQRLCRG